MKTITKNMKTITRGAALLMLLLASCGSKNTTTTSEQDTIAAEAKDVIAEADSIVYYYYEYPWGGDSHAEDNILELHFRGGEVADGYFWGTSDEFFEAREGFLPGYFVLRIKDVEQAGKRLSFTLDSRQTTYLSEPVSVDFHSADEALQNGGQPWEQYQEAFQDTARYTATFTRDGLVIHKDKSQYPYLDDHNFIRTRMEAIKQIQLSCQTNDPVEALKAVYESFAHEYGGDGWRDMDVTARQRFMTAELRNLYNESGKIAEELGEPYIDWDIWINAQDFDTLRIERAEQLQKNGDTARVRLQLNLAPEGSQHPLPSEITFAIKKEGGLWLIDDFLTAGISKGEIFSLKNYMTEFIKDNQNK